MKQIKSFIQRLNSSQDRIVKVFDKHAISVMYYSYAFVFFYFGLQKPAPAISPPRIPIGVAIDTIGFPLGVNLVMLLIGFYEMVLGLLFLFKKIRPAFWMFFIHQFVAFAVLLIIPYDVFQPPWLQIGPVAVPWLLDSFSAFVLKNVIFVAGFMLLCREELLQ